MTTDPLPAERLLCFVFPSRIEKMGNALAGGLYRLRLERLANRVSHATDRHTHRRAERNVRERKR